MRRYSLVVMFFMIMVLLSGCVIVPNFESMKAHGLDQRFPVYFVGTEPDWVAGEMDSGWTAWANVGMIINHPFNLPMAWAIVVYNSFICEGNTNFLTDDGNERKEVN